MSQIKNNISPQEITTKFGLLSIISACIALLFFPPLFGIIGTILGIIGIKKNEGDLPIIGLVLSIVFCILGMLLGILFWEI